MYCISPIVQALSCDNYNIVTRSVQPIIDCQQVGSAVVTVDVGQRRDLLRGAGAVHVPVGILGLRKNCR